MNAKELLDKALKKLRKKHVYGAIKPLDKLFREHPSLAGHDEFEAIKTNFGLMLEYMEKNFEDPHREDLYITLLQRLYVVTANLMVSWRCKHTPIYIDAFHKSDHLNTSYEFLRTVLESFVSDVALLSLEQEAVRKQKQEELYSRHLIFIERLFATIIVSLQWSEDDRNFYETLLLSPTVDVIDQQILVAGIMMSGINQFDINKFKLLTTVYQKAMEESVRQRALVGWVLMLNREGFLYDDFSTLVASLCSQKAIAKDLRDLQIQFLLNKDAKKDNAEIERNIMPDILKAQHAQNDRLGVNIDDKTDLENIFHTHDEEEMMEKMEMKINQMGEMYRNGSDVYFGGFRQMKSFPIFRSIVTWFSPFYIEHPELRFVREKIDSSKIIDSFVKNGAFCESDKYSFTCALGAVIDKIPPQIKEAISGDATLMPMGGIGVEQLQQPAYIRRMFIQDLYRFFQLYPALTDVVNPFNIEKVIADTPNVLFFAHNVFKNTGLDRYKLKIAFQLYKRKMKHETLSLLHTFHEETSNYYALSAHASLPMVSFDKFEKAIELDPTNEWAVEGYAKGLLGINIYDKAEELYQQLMVAHPDNLSYVLNYTLCLLHGDKLAAAKEQIFKLDYEHHDNKNVKRLLAWVLLNDNNLEKAYSVYTELLEMEPIKAEDYLNAGYSRWFKGELNEAIDLFRLWMARGKYPKTTFEYEFERDKALLDKYGISEVAKILMQTIAEK